MHYFGYAFFGLLALYVAHVLWLINHHDKDTGKYLETIRFYARTTNSCKYCRNYVTLWTLKKKEKNNLKS